MKKKGFTLVELLAVIVILAIILVIAIPQIMNVIKTARLSSIKDSAMLIAEQAEKDFIAQQVLNQDYSSTSIPCTDVAKLNDDYDSCTITYNNGIATVILKGKDGGKFSSITCTGTKDNMCCSTDGEESSCSSSGGSGSSQNDPVGTYVVSTQEIEVGTTLEELHEMDGIHIRNTASEVINDWKLITGEDKVFPFYLKLITEGEAWFRENSDYPYLTQEKCEMFDYSCSKRTVSDMVIDVQVGLLINDQIKTQNKAIYCSEDNGYYDAAEIAACKAKWDNLVNGSYTFGGNVGENGNNMKQAFNFTIQPTVCSEENEAFYSCGIDGLTVDSGFYSTYDGAYNRGSISDGREYGYRCWMGNQGYCGFY